MHQEAEEAKFASQKHCIPGRCVEVASEWPRKILMKFPMFHMLCCILYLVMLYLALIMVGVIFEMYIFIRGEHISTMF